MGGVSGDEEERERSKYSMAGVLGRIGWRCSGVGTSGSFLREGSLEAVRWE